MLEKGIVEKCEDMFEEPEHLIPQVHRREFLEHEVR